MNSLTWSSQQNYQCSPFCRENRGSERLAACPKATQLRIHVHISPRPHFLITLLHQIAKWHTHYPGLSEDMPHPTQNISASSTAPAQASGSDHKKAAFHVILLPGAQFWTKNQWLLQLAFGWFCLPCLQLRRTETCPGLAAYLEFWGASCFVLQHLNSITSLLAYGLLGSALLHCTSSILQCSSAFLQGCCPALGCLPSSIPSAWAEISSPQKLLGGRLALIPQNVNLSRDRSLRR